MSQSGIRFEDVWKKFRRGERHDSLRDLIPAMLGKLANRGRGGNSLSQDDFWAVRDVSFEVKPGECLGIIGGNGAGKSTILKLLSGILHPTMGLVELRGRIGSLIEVSAGFHPDLTGRENVFLQGAIMGMARADLRSRFDEIVEFAGVEAFIDTPVKRYSSGMNARLGFAIAVHLNPEVLLIDEVLAVGDYGFQKRAFDRVSAMAESGIPVVLVSHQLDRVVQLCSRAILLQQGSLVAEGASAEVVQSYLSGEHATARPEVNDCHFTIRRMELDPPPPVSSGDRISVKLHCERNVDAPRAGNEAIGLVFRMVANGASLAAFSTREFRAPIPDDDAFVLDFSLALNVGEGLYAFDSYVWNDHDILHRGPNVALAIAPTVVFDGLVQMMPHLSILPADGDSASIHPTF